MDLTKFDDGIDGEDNKKIKDKAKDPLSMPQGPLQGQGPRSYKKP